jgi:Spy/CpxP family protein refolding chaperone
MQNRRRAAILLAAMFLVGALCGAAGMLLANREGVGPSRERRRGPGGYVEHLTRTLDLAPEQRDSVRAIVERYRPAMDSLRREVAPRFETLQNTIRSEIRLQLSPDQQRRLADMTKRFDSMRTRGDDRHAPR